MVEAADAGGGVIVVEGTGGAGFGAGEAGSVKFVEGEAVLADSTVVFVGTGGTVVGAAIEA